MPALWATWHLISQLFNIQYWAEYDNQLSCNWIPSVMVHYLFSSPRSTRWIPTSHPLQLPARCARLLAPPRPTWPCTCFKRTRHSARKTTKMRKKCWSCPHSHWIIRLRSRPSQLNQLILLNWLILLNQLVRLNQLIHLHQQQQAAWRLTPVACVTRSCILGCI